MKTLAPLLFCVLPALALAKPPAPELLLTSASAGPIYIGMSPGDVDTVLPDGWTVRRVEDDPSRLNVLIGGRAAAVLALRDDGRVDAIEVLDRRFRTRDGFGVGVPLRDVLKTDRGATCDIIPNVGARLALDTHPFEHIQLTGPRVADLEQQGRRGLDPRRLCRELMEAGAEVARFVIPRPKPSDRVSRLIFGSGSVVGRCELAPIERVLEARREALRACYQARLMEKPDLDRGTVTLRWTIAYTGRTSFAAAKASTVPDDAVVNCLLGELSTATFPKPAQGPCTAEWPLTFEPGG